jgi:superfamily II DNA or RNA helicase
MKKTRAQIHKEAEDCFFENCSKGILCISQRVGKTYISCMIIKRIIELFPEINIDIYVPFVNLIEETWKPELIKWLGYVPKNITFKTHKSINKEKDFNKNFQIIDEIHLLSKQNMTKFVLAERVLGLTGTMNDQTRFDMHYILNINIIYEYSIIEAVKDGIIADFIVNVHYCNLDNKNKNVLSGNKFKSFYSTEKSTYDYLTGVFENYKELAYNNPSYNVQKRFASDKRMRFIYSSQTKINYVKSFLNKNINEKILVFASDIKTAEHLSKYSYHSKSKEDNLSKFNEEKFNHLSCCKMLNVGVTIPKLHKIVIQQLTSNEENTSQILARALNLEYSGKVAEINIFCIKNTVDDVWVNKSLSWIPKEKINYLQYD